MKKLLKNYATKKAYGGFIFGIVGAIVFSGVVAFVLAVPPGTVTDPLFSPQTDDVQFAAAVGCVTLRTRETGDIQEVMGAEPLSAWPAFFTDVGWYHDVGKPTPRGSKPSFGIECINGWIMTGCTHVTGDYYHAGLSGNGCYVRDKDASWTNNYVYARCCMF